MIFLYHINHNHIRIRIIKIISRNCENFITHPFFKKCVLKVKIQFFSLVKMVNKVSVYSKIFLSNIVMEDVAN